MKNVSLVPAYFGGINGETIIGPDGAEIYEARLFCEWMIKNRYALNTVATYMQGLARFFDYLLEAVGHCGNRLSSDLQLVEIIESWDDYLVFGDRSEDKWAQMVSRTMPNEMPKSKSSSAVWHAGLKRFLEKSESYRKKAQDLKELGLLKGVEIAQQPLIPLMGEKRELTGSEKKARIKNDVISAVIKGGPKFASAKYFPPISIRKETFIEESSHFPFEKITQLIDSASTPRNRCLYSLLAASGGRISECLQTRFKDIDFEKWLVFLTDHRDLMGDDERLSLSPAQWRALSYKGRKYRDTFLLAPYSRIFFEALYAYWDSIPYSAEHDFIFCSESKENWGKPLFLCHYSSIYKSFVRAADKVLGSGHGFGPHSLRHAYGFYLLNYCPNLQGGYGLELGAVQGYMGHAEVSSTARYAVKDKKILHAELEAANRIIYESGSLSANEVRLKALEAAFQAQKELVETERSNNQLGNQANA